MKKKLQLEINKLDADIAKFNDTTELETSDIDDINRYKIA